MLDREGGNNLLLKSNIRIYLNFQRLKKLYDRELFPNEEQFISKTIHSFDEWSLSQLVNYLDEEPKEKKSLNWEFRRWKRLEKLTFHEKNQYYDNYLSLIEDIGKVQLEIFENTIGVFGMKIEKDDKILEVGCGRGGFMSQYMKKYPNEIFGVDMDTSSLLINHKINKILKNTRYDLFAQFGDSLPFEEESFDFVVSFSTLEHVGDFVEKLKFINELKRVCKINGLIILEFPNRFNIFNPEAHVGLPFLGFFPSFFANRCSLLFRGMPYEDISPLSYLKLRRLISSSMLSRDEHKILPIHFYTKNLLKSLILNSNLGLYFGSGFIVGIRNMGKNKR